MLEPIFKGLVEWIYGMMIDIMAYASGELIGVMSMDLSYFERTAPVITDIVNIFIALGWAMLIGNLVFQVIKSMMSGIGFEAEDPKITFLRTFVFSFLLLASRQICDLCSGITGTVINLLELPSSINIVTPDESMFSLGSGAKWLLVIIVGVVLMVQMVKLLFEIGERYVITSVLTFFAPLAFSMGGSKNTNDIFKGWCRMYASMLVMMIMNIVFLKLIMSAMSQMAAGGVLIWLVFVVALTRVARKIDSHIGKLGLNPAQTGNEIGSRFPGLMTAVAIRTMGSLVSRSMANAKGGKGGKSGSGGRSGRNGGTTRPHGTRQRTGGFGTHTPTGGNGGTTAHTGGTTVQQTGGTTNTSVNHSRNQDGGSGKPNPQKDGKPKGGGGTPQNMPNQQKGAKPINTPKPQTVLGGGNKNTVPNPQTVHKSPHTKGGISTQETSTNTGQGGSVQNNEVTNQGRTPRPPIPRDTMRHGRNDGASYHTQNQYEGSSEHSTTHTDMHQNGGGHKTTSRPNGTVNVGGGEQFITEISESSRGGNVSAGTNVSSKNQETTVGGDKNSTAYGGNTNNRTEHSHSEKHTDQQAEHKHRTDRFEHQQNADKRIDHEYTNGRYNPAAANRKVKKTYYKKDNSKGAKRDMNMPGNRGGRNGTKRKK